MTGVFGVIGFPIKHSLSPVMHNAALRHLNYDGVYVPFEVKPEELEIAVAGMKSLNIRGINVTIPHKERIIEFFNPEKEVQEIGAANTVDLKSGKCYNTDVYGILEAINAAEIEVNGLKVLIIGAGGAAKACIYALRDSSRVYITNRTEAKGRAVAGKFGAEFVPLHALENHKFDLIVNATPLGMKGFESIMPVPLNLIKKAHAVFDMVYNPPSTPLVSAGRKFGCRIVSGIDMLVYQGARAFEIFTGQKAPVEVMKKAVMSEIENIR
ncbi:shikimate dehydrogenase [Geoglobus acetivorans]|uniref:Shikimate dehydrogenase (NADP(+)) n=1 Tax=Geoglobus acetivorans TaxID=565033 RepID=A0A0A7GEI3_GEOAI|nr:Shikimate 5-dehydrogenase I alpha [Geoglobus acetivorans]